MRLSMAESMGVPATDTDLVVGFPNSMSKLLKPAVAPYPLVKWELQN